MKKIRVSLILILLIGLTALYGAHENRQLDVSYYRIQSSLKRIRIAHISDLHNAEIGPQNEKLIQAVLTSEPDIILLTGDMFDGRHPQIDKSIDFVSKISGIVPIFYVSGNHEAYRPDLYAQFKEGIRRYGVQVLEDQSFPLRIKGQDMVLHGIMDSRIYGGRLSTAEQIRITQAALTKLNIDKSKTNILLSHRPERMAEYVEAGLDFVFSGHAHGGQFRIGRPLYAPGQGFFPKYAEGVIKEGNTTLVVSRGLGNSLIPLRINNRPELIIVDLLETAN